MMDRLVCGICMEELGSEKDVCCLPCGHVKHTSCLREWCKRQKKCPNCEGGALHLHFRKLFFDKEHSENKTPDNATALKCPEAPNQDFEKCKSELAAAQKCCDSLQESNRQLESKLQNSEVELRQISDKSQEQIIALRTMEAKARETLKINFEQELSDAQAKIKDLEAKLTQIELSKAHSSQVITLLEEKVGKLEKAEIPRLKSLQDAAMAELEVERRRRRDLSERILKLGAEVTKLNKFTSTQRQHYTTDELTEMMRAQNYSGNIESFKRENRRKREAAKRNPEQSEAYSAKLRAQANARNARRRSMKPDTNNGPGAKKAREEQNAGTSKGF